MPVKPERAKASSQLLQGVRVLDMTNVLAGPFCGYQLALQGAEIIKVEVPKSGDLARQLGADAALNKQQMGASFLAQNAGKRSITINLKKKSGRQVFERLAATSDVVLENFRPGVMDRLGIGYQELTKVRPDLIYCAISGFGQHGPLRENPAYDQIIQGLSGVMSVTGFHDSGPVRVGYPVCDTLGGITAAFAIASALYYRAATGEGQFIDVSMLDATLVALGWPVSNWLIANVAPTPMGNENFTASPSGTFRTMDGLLNIAANKQDQYEALCRLLEQEHLIEDCRFSDRESRKVNRILLRDEIELALMKNSSAHWERVLNQAGVPAGRVLSIPEVIESPQVKHRELIQSFDVVGIKRPVKAVRSGFRLSTAKVGVDRPPPLLGEHTEELLKELGYPASEIAALRSEGAL